MDVAARLSQADPALFQATRHKVVQLDTPDEIGVYTMVGGNNGPAGGEGMVVKPMAFIATAKRGLVQPAMKCRGIVHSAGEHRTSAKPRPLHQAISGASGVCAGS